MEGEIKLVCETNIIDDEGIKKPNTKEINIWATIVSVTYREVYEAMQVGKQPTKIFKVRYEDYIELIEVENQKEIMPSYVLWNNVKYEIIRVFTKNFQTMELTCG